jgi:uncharacterized protein YfdQ (DUF2303 family)
MITNTESKKIMKIDHFIQSELKVVASENLNITDDLLSTQSKHIDELLNNEKEESSDSNQKENQ